MRASKCFGNQLADNFAFVVGIRKQHGCSTFNRRSLDVCIRTCRIGILPEVFPQRPIAGMKLQNPPISANSGHQGTCAIANPVAYRSVSRAAMMSCERINTPRTRTDCRKGLPDGAMKTHVPIIFVHLSLQPSLRARIVPPRPVRFRKRQAARFRAIIDACSETRTHGRLSTLSIAA